MNVKQNIENQFMGDICVVSETIQLADRLMNDLLILMKDDEDIDHISRHEHKIYFKDHTIIKFIGRSQKNHEVQGFRGRIISETIFRSSIKLNMKNKSPSNDDGK